MIQDAISDLATSDLGSQASAVFAASPSTSVAPLSERIIALQQFLGRFSIDMQVGPAMGLRERIELLWALGVSPEVVHTALAISARFGSTIAPDIDAEILRGSMDRVLALEAAAEQTRLFQRQIEDEVLRSRAELGKDAVALYHTLRRLSKTPEGEQFGEAMNAMRDVIEGRVKKKIGDVASA